VTVVGSALDVVGLPGYGPILQLGPGGWKAFADAFVRLPGGLRSAWLNAASIVESGEPVLVLDRRAVSIETKRAMEKIPGLEFRQGLVVDVRVSADSAEVETAFGEVFSANTVVLAPGLALRGRVDVGEEVLPGGRYGEVPANELAEALSALGLDLTEISVDVKPHYAHDTPWIAAALACGESLAAAPMSSHCEVRRLALIPVPTLLAKSASMHCDLALDEAVAALRAVCLPGSLAVSPGAEPLMLGESGLPVWPETFPPAPHWIEQLRPDALVVAHQPEGDSGLAARGGAGIIPDGAATAEYYTSLLEEPSALVVGATGDEGLTRMGHRVYGLVTMSIDGEGRSSVLSDRIRIVGQAAGAKDYLGSLRSGLLAAEGLMRELGCGRGEE
jgi:hypothetical protein